MSETMNTSFYETQESMSSDMYLVAISKLKQLLPEEEYKKIEKRSDYSLFLEKISNNHLNNS